MSSPTKLDYTVPTSERLNEGEQRQPLHRMKVNKGATETLLTVAGKLGEDFVKLKWGELANYPYPSRPDNQSDRS